MNGMALRRQGLAWVFLVLLWTSSAFPANLVVSGITTPSAANGTYAPIADLNGNKAWKHTTQSYYIYNRIYTSGGTDAYWNIDTDNDDHNTALFYVSSTTTPPVGLTWSKDAGVGTPVVVVEGAPLVPEINVQGNGKDILKGDLIPSYPNLTKFGAVNIASGSTTRTFVIQNNGAGALHVSGVAIGGSNAADFTVTTQPASTVASTGTTSFVVAFDPSAVGNRNATVTITNDDADEGSYTFAIQGYGFTPSDIELSGVTTPSGANGKYVFQGVLNEFEYWKGATNGLYIYNKDYNNAGTRYWDIDSNLVDMDNNYLFFIGSDAGSPVGLTEWTLNKLDGYTTAGAPFISQGTPIPEINIQGNSTSIASGDTVSGFNDGTNFGSIDLSSGTRTRTRTFTIQNLGTAALTLSGSAPYVAISGANASDFSISTAPSPSIAVNSSTTFVVTFNPAAVGTRTATLTIANNDADEGAYAFAIQGDGFKPKNVVVSGITTPAAENGTYVYQGILNEFPYWKQGAYYLYNKQYQTSGRFWDIDTNLDDAHVSFFSNNHNDNASPATVTNWGKEAGNGCAGAPVVQYAEPEMDVQGNSVSIADGDETPSVSDHTDFGSVSAASGTVVRTYTIRNTGLEILTLGSNAVSITGVADFTVTTQPATTVSAGGSTTFQVTFDPVAAGLRSASISIANNDADENPYNFAIQGTGINTAPVATPPTAPVVAEDDVNVELANDIQIADADGDGQTVTFVITGGTLSLGTTGITFGGGGNGTAGFTASGSLAAINTALRAATFTPTPNLNGSGVAAIAFRSNDGTANSNNASVAFGISSVNDAPTLTKFAGVVATTVQNTEVEIDLAALKAQGDEADVDGTVDAFSVGTVSGGTLRIGSSAISATAFDASANKTIDASHKAYWTPARDASGTPNAFSVVALDNNGAPSVGAVQVAVRVDDVKAPEVSGITIVGAPQANAATVTFAVLFTEAVVHVTADDFSLTTTGSAHGTIASVGAVSGTGFEVVVDGISGTGTIRLDLKASSDIADGAGNASPAAYAAGSSYAVDRDAPALVSSNPASDATGVPLADNLAFTFDQDIAFGTGDIQIVDLDDAAGTITIDASAPGTLASIDGKTLTIDPSGDLKPDARYAIRIPASALSDGHGNLFPGIADRRFATVKTQTIAFDPLVAKTYGDAPFALAATSSSGQTVTYTTSDPSVAAVSGDVVTIVGAGKATITANRAAGAGYLAAVGVPRSLVVGPRTLTIAGLSAIDKEYDGTNTAAVSGTPALSGVVSVDAAEVALAGSARAAFVDGNAGDDKAVSVDGFALTGARKANYTLSQLVLLARISRKPVTVAANPGTKAVGASDPVLTYSAPALVGSDSWSGALTRDAGESEGEYPIRLGTLSAGGNYAITYVGANLTIERPAALANRPVHRSVSHEPGATIGRVFAFASKRAGEGRLETSACKDENSCLSLDVVLPGTATVSVAIFDNLGTPVIGFDRIVSMYDLQRLATTGDGRRILPVSWNLRSPGGAPVPSGVYLWKIVVITDDGGKLETVKKTGVK